MSLLRRMVQGVSIAGGIVAGLGGFWLVYSRVGIRHGVGLPDALAAPRWSLNTSAGRVSYYANMTGSGRPLVLIHSVNAAASAFEMQPLFAHYQGKRPVYALDLPGFGFAERADRAYTPALYASAIAEFLETVVEEPADVVALSLGSEFAARAALDAPGSFHSLALISPTGLERGGVTVTATSTQATTVEATTATTAAATPSARGAAESQAAASSAERRYRLLSKPLWARPLFDLIVTRASIHTFLQRSFVGPVPQALEEYAYVTSHQPGAEHAPLAFISGLLFTPEAASTLYARLSLPVLVLYDQDAYVRFDGLESFVRGRANRRSVRITPTRGLPQWEKPEATTGALDTFWQGA